MGDWAEQRLSEAIGQFGDWRVAQYGDTNRIAAGDAGFRESYLAGLEGTRRFGKRPDLLIFPAASSVAADLSALSYAECEPLLKQAIAVIEVRSSKFEALTYIRVREQQREAGKAVGRDTPSFTVKVEDLIIVYRWLERYRIPESYSQVFFDSIYAINFLDIFSIIAEGRGFMIETPEKSQQKATIMIPITRGKQVGRAIQMPTFAARERVTALGRHDAYVVPEGGAFELERSALEGVLLPEL
jgi:hypothetical protein